MEVLARFGAVMQFKDLMIGEMAQGRAQVA